MTATVESSPRSAERTATVATRVAHWAHREPDRVALREKRLGIWQEITWAEYWEQVQLLAHGLRELGVAAGDRVAIHSENRPEWLFADVGAVAARAITIGLYPTNPSAEVRYLLADSKTKVLIAENQEQVDKALMVIDEVPDLEWIVYIEPRGVREYEHPALIWWPDLLERGRAHRDAYPALLDELAEQVGDDDVVTLVYTSGTTGPPKGAMLTVANVNFAIDVLIDGGRLMPDAGPDDLTLSFLPLAHVADRLGTEWANAAVGTQVHFAESIDAVNVNLREVQPTVFFAVPRIWEKLRATAEVRIASASWLKRSMYRFWMRNAAAIGRDWSPTAACTLPALASATRSVGCSSTGPARPNGPAQVPSRGLWRRADRARGARVVLRHRRRDPRDATARPRTPPWPPSTGPAACKLGTVGEPYPGTELRLDGRPARSSRAASRRLQGLLGTPRGDRRDARRRRVAAHRRRGGMGRRHGYLTHHRPHQGHHHHRRRQERLAVGDRELV